MKLQMKLVMNPRTYFFPITSVHLRVQHAVVGFCQVCGSKTKNEKAMIVDRPYWDHPILTPKICTRCQSVNTTTDFTVDPSNEEATDKASWQVGWNRSNAVGSEVSPAPWRCCRWFLEVRGMEDVTQ